MKKMLKVIGFILLNAFVLCVIVLSLMIFTSPYKMFPWYEPDTIEFLGIFILSPVYLILGTSLIGISKILPISKINRRLPFITGAGFIFITLFIDHFYRQVIITGICFGIVMFIVVTLSAIKDSIIISKVNI